MIVTTTDKRAQLERDGYCLFEGVLDDDLLAHTRQVSNRLLDAQPAEHFAQQKSTGSMVSVHDDPFFADLVSAPAALKALQSLGYDDPKWWSGFVISKPPHSPALFRRLTPPAPPDARRGPRCAHRRATVDDRSRPSRLPRRRR